MTRLACGAKKKKNLDVFFFPQTQPKPQLRQLNVNPTSHTNRRSQTTRISPCSFVFAADIIASSQLCRLAPLSSAIYTLIVVPRVTSLARPQNLPAAAGEQQKKKGRRRRQTKASHGVCNRQSNS
ncbi:hypothetical protein H112_05950 [Trichophyton rubrum D6]|uniref:Uncharacterized protein n=2 Tax=Trichophyton TaxID=5550 RepID=A0A022VWL3_TRIRU|nr:hypothetical protein H100_05965 [Trichophyton rubrum MR850]EZF39992.1 hypothetical protein H102_05934 [Trichophyton rubrum CBS 100081]EZF50627.1 hypothetical protein H103_05960 [Trichophyton rubrum CBS 288.86]EZF61080.1 hypothetical protein H104_05947 [Trichophyton rubrum CBS 289.86]EZF71852.1 hypothetical protein H105_05974 [Trichophyton soudanense CBS 452.61]EZF82550.1 hypothetical protein H110_05956 [Trichophyton rubrum MR1448]EZF93256.1 hypothetical protein H113_06003 [Trichophyton rub